MFGSLSDISGAPSFTGGAGGAATTGDMKLNSAFDSSGWTVNTGSGSASGAAALNPWLIAGLAVAGLLAWKMYRKK